MSQTNRMFMNYVEKAFIFFILAQPALDILAYVNVPVSTILRGLAIGVAAGYLLCLPDGKWKKLSITYLIVLGAFMICHILNNHMVKAPFSISIELTYVLKTVYFIVMLIVYVFVIKSFSKQKNWQKVLQVIVFINLLVISFVMLAANMTNSGHRSYGALAKEGHSGWFFSANELSVILGMGFSIMLLYILKVKSTRSKILLLPVSILVIWAMLTVGTKVSFGSVIIVLGIALTFYSIKTIYNLKNWLNIIILLVLLTASLLMTPATPIGNNLGLTFGTNVVKQETDVSQSEKGTARRNILSGRSDFLYDMTAQYSKAPLSQKLLGMGFGGNYTIHPKLIEMDFLDWYFNFGLIGFVLLFLPLLCIGFRILSSLFKYRFSDITAPIIFTGAAVCLGMGSAFVAGHVLSSPAVSIYLAVLIGYLHTLAGREGSWQSNV